VPLIILTKLKEEPMATRRRFAFERSPGRAYSMAAGIDYQIGVADGCFKYIVDIDGGYERLYDLKTDPREQTDVAAQHRK
jgi:hypothetical protein